MKFQSKDDLTKWAMSSRCLWLFLDYDGTLADFAPTPDHIEPNPGIIDLLRRLSHKLEIRITVISGRRLQHIRQLVPIRGIFLAGTYGIELLMPSGEMVHRVEYGEIRPMLEAIKPSWEQLIHGRDGFYLEDKGWSLALHARFASDQAADQVLAKAREVIDPATSANDLRLMGGHKFLEVAPWLASKRDAVKFLLERYPFSNSHLLYIGDDDKDEEAFPVIHQQGGVAVKVMQPSQRSNLTTADVFFSSPSETVDWLRELV